MNNSSSKLSFQHIESSVRKYYESVLAEYGDTPKGVNWSTADTQQIRFDILCGIADLSGNRIHDLGCGLAHLHDYLEKRKINCDYIGSDLSEKMIAAAISRLGDRVNLYTDNIMNHSADWMQADYVLNSGVFTVQNDISDAEWWDYICATIKRMFELSNKGIAFNLMTHFVDYQDDHLYYANPSRVLDFCVKELSRSVIIRHDYPLYEFTTYVYKT